jgi:hypothetical protein
VFNEESPSMVRGRPNVTGLPQHVLKRKSGGEGLSAQLT